MQPCFQTSFSAYYSTTMQTTLHVLPQLHAVAAKHQFCLTLDVTRAFLFRKHNCIIITFSPGRHIWIIFESKIHNQGCNLWFCLFPRLFLHVYKSWSSLWRSWMLPFSWVNYFLEPPDEKCWYFHFFFKLYSFHKFNRKSNGRVKMLKCEIRLLYSYLNFLFMRFCKG